MGTGAMGKQQHWSHARWSQGNPGPCLQPRPSNGAGWPQGPCLEIAGLASAPVGTERPSCSPSLLKLTQDTWALMTTYRIRNRPQGVHGKCCTGPWRTWCCQHFHCHVMEPRTRGPTASENEREMEGRRQNSSPLPPARDQAEPGVIHTL